MITWKLNFKLNSNWINLIKLYFDFLYLKTNCFLVDFLFVWMTIADADHFDLWISNTSIHLITNITLNLITKHIFIFIWIRIFIWKTENLISLRNRIARWSIVFYMKMTFHQMCLWNYEIVHNLDKFIEFFWSLGTIK